MILVLLLYFLFASTFTLAKAVVEYIQPIFFIGIRMTLAGSLLLGYQYFFNKSQWKFERRDLLMFGHIVLFLIVIPYIGEFWALQYVSAAKTSLIFNLSPFLTALLAYFVLSERLRSMQWLGLFVGCVGMLPILITHTGKEMLTHFVGFLSTPELALLAAVGASAYAWIVMKYLIMDRDYSPLMVNGVGMLGGGLVALALSALFEGWTLFGSQNCVLQVSTHCTDFLLLITYTALLIIISNIVCYNLYGYLLQRYSPTFLSFAGFTTPIFTALFDWMFFGDIVPMAFGASMCVVILGLYLFHRG